MPHALAYIIIAVCGVAVLVALVVAAGAEERTEVTSRKALSKHRRS